ncbi:MAG: FHA domain-containing protein [Acidobacteriota bacterium]|nr:FHA domain-containing protein [Acidobacteriota bacterium]
MNDLLVAPIHVLCVAGPDAGKAFVPTPAGVTLGREADVNVRDRETSRGHLFIRLVSTRRGELVEVQDRDSSNGFATGRWVAPAPGFGRNWARVKKVKSGGGSALLGPGSVFLVGSNLWEVKARPVSFDLKTAVQYDGSKRSVGRRSWMYLLPLISIVWLLARFLGGALALALAGLLLAVAVYTWFAIRSRRRPQPWWGIIYGLDLPPKGASFQAEGAPSDGFESGADGHSGPSTDSFGPHGPALVGAAPVVAGRPTVTGHSLSTRGEDWIIDFSEAPL